MRLMGIEALYRKPKTAKRHPLEKAYPHPLRNLAATRPMAAQTRGRNPRIEQGVAGQTTGATLYHCQIEDG